MRTIAQSYIEEGYEKGIMQGMEKGKIEGLEEGIERGKIETLKSMLSLGVATDIIKKVTGFTEQEIKKYSL